MGLVDANQSFSCWPEIEIKKETVKIEFILRFSIAIIRPKFKKNFQISIFNFATSLIWKWKNFNILPTTCLATYLNHV